LHNRHLQATRVPLQLRNEIAYVFLVILLQDRVVRIEFDGAKKSFMAAIAVHSL